VLPYIYEPKIHLGIISINTWGTIVAMGFIISLLYALKRAEKLKLNKDHIYNISLIAIVTGILGSRLLYLLFQPEQPLLNFLKIWQGGLTLIGGVITAVIFYILYVKIKKISFYKYADALTPPLIIAVIIGRIGCFIGDGGHLGHLTSLPWAILGRHPGALYSIVALIIIFIVIKQLEKEKQYPQGTLFISFIWLYSILRFIIEIFRTEQVILGLSVTQLILIPLFIISTTWLIKFKKRRIQKEKLK